MKVYRIEIKRSHAGWSWIPTDAKGTVTLPGGRHGYSTRFNAVHGAKRAHPTAKIIIA